MTLATRRTKKTENLLTFEFRGGRKTFFFPKKSSGRKNHTKNFFLFIRGPALVTVVEPCRCPWSLGVITFITFITFEPFESFRENFTAKLSPLKVKTHNFQGFFFFTNLLPCLSLLQCAFLPPFLIENKKPRFLSCFFIKKNTRKRQGL